MPKPSAALLMRIRRETLEEILTLTRETDGCRWIDAELVEARVAAIRQCEGDLVIPASSPKAQPSTSGPSSAGGSGWTDERRAAQRDRIAALKASGKMNGRSGANGAGHA